jgi:acetoin utilization deacetylase AcuC-like enzyme
VKTSRRIRLVYSKDYAVDIGNHVFPTSKYGRIKERLLKESDFRNVIDFVRPDPASEEDLLAVHDGNYIDKLKNGTLTREEVFRLELPYSEELVRSSLICCGGTVLAVDIALSDRLGVHIGGGFHHAYADHGEGFCVLNDIAVAARRAIRKGLAARVMIIDCDLHQGNGTASIFSLDPGVFTFSIHQENNYPFFKERSGLDIGLRDRAGDKEYMAALCEHIPKIVSDFRPGLIIYAAGADPYKDDKIGGLSITKGGLQARDEFIFRQAVHFDVPIALVLAGGYAYDEDDTVDIHYATITSALKIMHGRPAACVKNS